MPYAVFPRNSIRRQNGGLLFCVVPRDRLYGGSHEMRERKCETKPPSNIKDPRLFVFVGIRPSTMTSTLHQLATRGRSPRVKHGRQVDHFWPVATSGIAETKWFRWRSSTQAVLSSTTTCRSDTTTSLSQESKYVFCTRSPLLLHSFRDSRPVRVLSLR